MISTILLSLSPILIPLASITLTMGIPIVAIVFHYRQKEKEMDERKLMIERGITPPPLNQREPRKVSTNKTLQNGLNLIGIALGLLFGFYIAGYLGVSRFFGIGGGILFFLGVSNLLQAIIFTPKNQNEK